MKPTILTLNAGSSSIKFAVFDIEQGHALEIARGQVEGLGGAAHFAARVVGGERIDESGSQAADIGDHDAALKRILGFLKGSLGQREIVAVGHRVVHGGITFAEPVIASASVQAELARLNPLAPLHQPHNLAAIKAAERVFPSARQVACFDTAFHRTHEWTYDTFALPRSFYEEGVRRYGFHGLSYEYVAGRLAAIDPQVAGGRVVVAHLGNGASMCAMRGGRSVASTMGFSAVEGLPMGTRCGQLDPGVVLYLMTERAMTPSDISDLLYKKSGLKGLSGGLSHDMRELEASESPAAKQAIAYFVAAVRREIGAMAAVLSGLDAVVFCGGIGEHAVNVRAEVLKGLDFLGIAFDEARNAAGEGVISAAGSKVRVHIVATDEEAMIARHTARLVGLVIAA